MSKFNAKITTDSLCWVKFQEYGLFKTCVFSQEAKNGVMVIAGQQIPQRFLKLFFDHVQLPQVHGLHPDQFFFCFVAF